MIRTFEEVSRFTVGTIGVPGDRTFFIQFRSGNQVVSTSLEKSQVGALSERLNFMLREIRSIHPLSPKPILKRDSLPLEIPVLDEFRVGSIAIFYDEQGERIQIDLRELNLNNDESDDDDEELVLSSFSDTQLLRLFISPTQALIFHDRAELVIAAGRQPCPFCGLPINPEGHLCARANGYRR
jgi:uncharacterized repeat protein (TIGR03847 family)